MKRFNYKSIFIYSSLQFSGHVEEFFSENTEKLIVFVVMPRLKNKYNLLRVYSKGKLRKEKRIKSSSNIFLYYFLWWWHQNYFILKYFSKKDNFIIFGCHPVCFFGMSLIKFIKKCRYAYWVGDYFPGNSNIISLFERLKRYYHDKMNYAFYLSDNINKVFNKGEIVDNHNKKTVMWGIKPKKIVKKLSNKQFHMLFIGLIKDSQGLEFIFSFLRGHKNYKISIIGLCDDTLYLKYKNMIKVFKIENQVYFPNKFLSNDDLAKFSLNCDIGIALYNIDKSNPTYYTDPGKVKAYAELNLPVIMSSTSAISPFIKRFKAGEVISKKEESLQNALIKIKKNHQLYKRGLKKFNDYFYYKKYYNEKFNCFKI